MRQALSLLSYRGRFHTTKSLLYLAKWPSSERSSRLSQASLMGQPILAPFFFCRATRDGPSQQALTEIPSPVGGFIPSSSEGSAVGSSLSATSIPSGGHQHDMAAVTRVPLRSAVQAEIGLLGTVSPLEGKHRNVEWAYKRILLSREPSGSHQQAFAWLPSI